MTAATNPLTTLCDGLARQLHEEPSNPYILDLGWVIRVASPVLLDLLHKADGTVTFVWENGGLFMETKSGRKRLLP